MNLSENGVVNRSEMLKSREDMKQMIKDIEKIRREQMHTNGKRGASMRRDGFAENGADKEGSLRNLEIADPQV